ncbi:ThuA domain-containing protein [Chitinophaga nivalis]|uniref:ThuA domain-containing protein n=1 Tax=Chitinophaga nivalis TaxID=2991709 RepID=A0ABT3ITZ7_9BACT|nr:ThuA domain-containing protein [Chitinophaga nivalis]MCW3462939.1 ThuA domain-containing protein [Chitinophaga nivalis]MCW3487371.1 ThuA domain-containing protein [Chitinophaga nivalis]
MKQLVKIILPLIMACSFACKKTPPATSRVLVFTKTMAYRHNAIPAGISALQQLGRKNGFDVDTTENAASFTSNNLQRYDAVIFLNTTGDVLNKEQEAAFERYIQSGGGYVGVHAATDTEYEWGWYNHLAGAYFQSHPDGVHEAVLTVTDTAFPATARLPRTWKHTDEWYNFKQLDTSVHVLLKVDEHSYEGGTMNNNHPVSWYHDYDGGRAFYTALGHTKECYTDDVFLQHLLGGIQYAMGATKVPAEDRFTKTMLVAGEFFEPTEMTILPNLDILVAQRRGELMLYNQATKKLSQAGFLKVYYKTDIPDVNAEEGFIGLAADPDFAKNHYIYTMYSPVDTSVNRLSRFKFENNQLDMSSEKVILEFYSQRYICCHTGGSIAFGPDKLLYVSTGDNTTPFDEPGQKFGSKGFGPTDDRPGHQQYDGRRSSANTNDLRGKILRIKVAEDGSYTVPDGNLFPKGTKDTRPEIFAMGTRNPYRISIDPKNGFVYWGEVGPDANEDDPSRGPRGYDEINQAKKPGNYGYPLFIANNQPYHAYNYETGESGPAYDPLKPVNNSRNNTGLQLLPPAVPAMIWYPYGPSAEFPITGSGGRNAEAGPVYYSDLYPEATRLPDYYNGKLFIYDWIRGWMMAVTLDKDANFAKIERFLPHTKLNAPIDMEMGPDGRLYVLEYGNGWFSKNADAGLARIDYNGGNLAPVARIQASQLTGALPFTVKLTANGSMDPEGDALTYLWYFGNGNKKETHTPDVEYTYTTAGEYAVAVEVIDAHQAKTRSQPIDLYAGNETPRVQINITGNRQFYFPGKPVAYNITVDDKEDNSHGIDAANVWVKADYLQGHDKAGSTQGHQVITGAIAGKNIMEVSDCKTCHKTDEKSIGPSFRQVAQKYRKDPAAPDMLAKKIINGGGGVWGETAMAAHPGISLGEARQLVEYIYSLDDKAPKMASLPMKGSLQPGMGQPLKDNGVLYLTASYTDRGAPGIKPITGTAAVELYSPVLTAADYSKADGVNIFAVGAMRFLVPAAPQGSATFNNLDLTGVNGIELTYMVQAPQQYGYVMEIWMDGEKGTRLGEITIGPGAAPKVPNKAAIHFTPPAAGGQHALYIRFRTTTPGQQAQLGILSLNLKQS